jgi:tRNA pseudouridine55 synthase
MPVCIYKKCGETPLEALERLREIKPEFKNKTLSYAGRLDPMAEGVLLVLVEEENKQREKYLSQDKTYEATMLFGIETDTYDILGKVVETIDLNNALLDIAYIADCLKDFVGEHTQVYPPFSSQPVDGKPLFEWAREGRLLEITIPTKKVYVQSISVKDVKKLTPENLLKIVSDKIALVKNNLDFRQSEILEIWKSVLHEKNTQEYFITAHISVVCSSGTYIRSIIHDAGKKLGTNAIALSIIRTQVGEKKLEDCVI